MTGKALVAVTATGPSGACLRRRQPYGQEVRPVPNCKRRLRVQLVATVAATGVLTATAVAATVDGDDGSNRLKGSPEADVIRAFGGNDGVLAFAGDDGVLLGAGDDRTFMGPVIDNLIEWLEDRFVEETRDVRWALQDLREARAEVEDDL